MRSPGGTTNHSQSAAFMKRKNIGQFTPVTLQVQANFQSQALDDVTGVNEDQCTLNI